MKGSNSAIPKLSIPRTMEMELNGMHHNALGFLGFLGEHAVEEKQSSLKVAAVSRQRQLRAQADLQKGGGFKVVPGAGKNVYMYIPGMLSYQKVISCKREVHLNPSNPSCLRP